MLALLPPLCQTLGLRSVPHYSTLDPFAARALDEPTFAALFTEVIRQAGGSGAVDLALDSTGLATCKRRLKSVPGGGLSIGSGTTA